ncbi:MAG: transposase [Alphaproteobacteria bacterium]
MTRLARVVVPGLPHHVTQRGNRGLDTFLREGDYEAYRGLLAERAAEAGVEIWAYCLMPNHVHLILVPPGPDGLRAALGETHRRYTKYINQREGWQGHLWQERFHSYPMDEAHLLAAARYIERNPVAAGLAKAPADWRWSSASAHLSAKDDALVTVAPMLERVPDWRQFLGQEGKPEMAARIELHTRTGRPLGADDFLKSLESRLGRSLQPKSPGRPRKKPGA